MQGWSNPVRNAEVRGSTPLCSTNCFQLFTAAGTGGRISFVANLWTLLRELSFIASTATRFVSSTDLT